MATEEVGALIPQFFKTPGALGTSHAVLFNAQCQFKGTGFRHRKENVMRSSHFFKGAEERLLHVLQKANLVLRKIFNKVARINVYVYDIRFCKPSIYIVAT